MILDSTTLLIREGILTVAKPKFSAEKADPLHPVTQLADFAMNRSSYSFITQHVPSVNTNITSYGMASNSIKLLTGNSHPELAKLVASR